MSGGMGEDMEGMEVDMDADGFFLSATNINEAAIEFTEDELQPAPIRFGDAKSEHLESGLTLNVITICFKRWLRYNYPDMPVAGARGAARAALEATGDADGMVTIASHGGRRLDIYPVAFAVGSMHDFMEDIKNADDEGRPSERLLISRLERDAKHALTVLSGLFGGPKEAGHG